MNQTQRDLTYRLDAVRQACDQYGQESDICQQSIQLWKSQHDMNVFNVQISFYIKLAGSVLVIFVFSMFVYSKFLKLKTRGLNTNDSNIKKAD